MKVIRLWKAKQDLECVDNVRRKPVITKKGHENVESQRECGKPNGGKDITPLSLRKQYKAAYDEHRYYSSNQAFLSGRVASCQKSMRAPKQRQLSSSQGFFVNECVEQHSQGLDFLYFHSACLLFA